MGTLGYLAQLAARAESSQVLWLKENWDLNSLECTGVHWSGLHCSWVRAERARSSFSPRPASKVSIKNAGARSHYYR